MVVARCYRPHIPNAPLSERGITPCKLPHSLPPARAPPAPRPLLSPPRPPPRPPGLPADWSPFQFLVLELRLSSPQRFDLRIHDAGGVRSVRLAPVPGAWIRSAVPLNFLTEAAHQGMDLASVHNKARPMMFINLSGTPGELKSVREIGVVMANPIGAPYLEIRAVRLANQDPGDALLEAKPLVDQFGQWMGDDWPGKAASLDQLQAAWVAEEKAFDKGES